MAFTPYCDFDLQGYRIDWSRLDDAELWLPDSDLLGFLLPKKISMLVFYIDLILPGTTLSALKKQHNFQASRPLCTRQTNFNQCADQTVVSSVVI